MKRYEYTTDLCPISMESGMVPYYASLLLPIPKEAAL